MLLVIDTFDVLGFEVAVLWWLGWGCLFGLKDAVAVLVFLVWKGARCFFLSVLVLVMVVALEVEVVVVTVEAAIVVVVVCLLCHNSCWWGCCGYGRSGMLTKSCQRHSCSPSSWCR